MVKQSYTYKHIHTYDDYHMCLGSTHWGITILDVTNCYLFPQPGFCVTQPHIIQNIVIWISSNNHKQWTRQVSSSMTAPFLRPLAGNRSTDVAPVLNKERTAKLIMKFRNREYKNHNKHRLHYMYISWSTLFTNFANCSIQGHIHVCTMEIHFFKGTDSTVFQILHCQACDFLCNIVNVLPSSKYTCMH